VFSQEAGLPAWVWFGIYNAHEIGIKFQSCNEIAAVEGHQPPLAGMILGLQWISIVRCMGMSRGQFCFSPPSFNNKKQEILYGNYAR